MYLSNFYFEYIYLNYIPKHTFHYIDKIHNLYLWQRYFQYLNFYKYYLNLL